MAGRNERADRGERHAAPRLSAIEPDELVGRLVEGVVDHLRWQASWLSPAVAVAVEEGAGGGDEGAKRPLKRRNYALGTKLGLTLGRLLAFARRGDSMSVDEAVRSVGDVYMSFLAPPLQPSVVDVDSLIETGADAWTEIGLVLLAAQGRIHLALGQSVSAFELGAVADASAEEIERMIRHGSLPGRGGRVQARAAEWFLVEGARAKGPAGERPGGPRVG